MQFCVPTPLVAQHQMALYLFFIYFPSPFNQPVSQSVSQSINQSITRIHAQSIPLLYMMRMSNFPIDLEI